MSSSANTTGSTNKNDIAINTTDTNSGNLGNSLTFNTTDSCTWYNHGKCTRPRTCADCLNVVLSNDSCVVDPRGVCVSMSQYENYLADRYYYTPLEQHFPSTEYTYCSINDSVCTMCSKQWNVNFATTGTAGMNSHCTGTGGCVCIADCEVPDWKDIVIQNQCSSSSSESGAASGASVGTRLTESIIGGIALALIVALAMWGVRRFGNRTATDQNGFQRETRLSSRPPSLRPQLSLTGWKSLRQNLIDSESEITDDSQRLSLQHHAQDSFTPATTDLLGSSQRERNIQAALQDRVAL